MPVCLLKFVVLFWQSPVGLNRLFGLVSGFFVVIIMVGCLLMGFSQRGLSVQPQCLSLVQEKSFHLSLVLM